MSTQWKMLVKLIADERETLLLQRRLTSAEKRWNLLHQNFRGVQTQGAMTDLFAMSAAAV